jgi:hypothetical protein
VEADVFEGCFSIPDLARTQGSRIYLELDQLAPEAAAHVTLNGRYVGGFIGKPFRLDISHHVRSGTNGLTIAPFSPTSARVVLRPRER